jgi:steroid delta-isomerase
MADPAAMRATVEQYTQRHSAGDIPGIVALFAPDCRIEDPIGSDPHVGTEAATAFFTGSHDLADSLDLSLTGPVRVAGNLAAFPMQVITTLGESKLALDIIDVMEFTDDGKIADMKAYWSFDDARAV